MASSSTPKVISEDEYAWLVECDEPGCTNAFNVGKRTGRPADYADPKSEIVWSANELRGGRCALHGPKLSR